jgi:hypothetical protein
MSKVKIGPETLVYTITADGVGYALEDSILGTQSAAEYAANCSGTDRDVQGLCEWLEDAVASYNGFFLSEQDAQDFLDDEEERGSRRNPSEEIEWFTPKGVHEYILGLAKQEDADRRHNA